MKFISFSTATRILLFLCCAVFLFHIAVIAGFVPADMVWGGRLDADQDLFTMELVSLAVNLFLAATVMLRAQILPNRIPVVALRIVLWLFVIIFSLNTVGNLLALNSLETWIFTPVTLVSALLCLRLALEPSFAIQRS